MRTTHKSPILSHSPTKIYVSSTKDKVGVDPKLRSFDKPTLIAGIQNPEKELARLRKIDSDSAKEDIQRTYRS